MLLPLAALFTLSLTTCSAQTAPPPTVINYYNAAGDQGHEGDIYRVSLQVQERKLVAKVQALARGSSTQYADVMDLEAAGKLTGKAILMSLKGGVQYLRSLMDPMEYEAGIVGPWLTFNLSQKPEAGAYRLFLQVRRGGRELSFPFGLIF